jgi:hypothetical protein
MENSRHIKFKKQRELGEIITVTFQFIRENYKPLFSAIYKIVGPFFILIIATLAYYTYSLSGNAIEAILSGTGNFIISIPLLGISLLLFYAALNGTILHYIKCYVKNEGHVEEAEVKQGVKKDFFRLFFLAVISGILIVAGLIMLILPGIYILVPLALAGAILVFKDFSVTESISYCFSLVRGYWWMTFVTLIVVYLLVYIIGLVFQVPLIIYTIIQTFTTIKEGSVANPEIFTDWVFITLNVFSSVIQYLLSTISIIALAFIYFDLNEQKNLTGTFETIDKLGN